MQISKNRFIRIVQSMGLVFGDIGTSPIYTLTVLFLFTPKTEFNIIGVLSLIFWTLTLLVTVEYAWLATSLNKRGEGGDIVLREILLPLFKSPKLMTIYTVLTFTAISLLIGDGVITPAISILSAVEGMRLIPVFENIHQYILIIIAAAIAIGLFSFQKKGAGKVSGTFGPLMVLWFSVLALSGLISILHYPQIFKAINPYYALKFLFTHGFLSFIVLSNVILCATGGEALYADMGHLGRKPIVRAWYIVFVALILNYFGQGVFVLRHPEAKNILFGMIFQEFRDLYVPFLILSVVATIIASQAMISGMFSIVYQGITTRIMPMFKVDYTSEELRSQIYIGLVNWFLLFFVIIIMFVFKESSNLAAAYGLAVTGSMSITGTLMTTTFYLKKKYAQAGIALFVTLIDLVFLFSNTLKIPHGGYWSIIIAIIPLAIILIYTNGQKRLYKSLKPMDGNTFIEKYNEMYNNCNRIQGTALFFARDAKRIPPYISNTMFSNGIIYDDNIIVSMSTKDEPFGIEYGFEEILAYGLRVFKINVGYLEGIEIEEILKVSGIYERVIFYGLEDIETENLIWKIFEILKKITPAYVEFYKLPADKLHGVITRIEI